MAKQNLTETLLKVHSPWLLVAYALTNIAAALFYGAIGTSKMLEIIYFAEGAQKTISFENTIQLLDRSLMHSAIAGVALLGGHVMTRLGQMSAARAVSPQWFENFLSKKNP